MVAHYFGDVQMTYREFYKILIMLLVLCIIGFFGPIFIMLLAPNYYQLPMIYGQVFSVVIIAGVLIGIYLETDK
tara:strand:- start:717 stop:938 length:222 start_codon:yes stop_codon:yes gene_type:complete